MGCSGSKTAEVAERPSARPSTDARLAAPPRGNENGKFEQSHVQNAEVIDVKFDGSVSKGTKSSTEVVVHKEGFISFKDFLKLPELEEIIESNLIGTKMMQDLFEIIDKDADGLIDKAEINELMDLIQLTYSSRGGRVDSEDEGGDQNIASSVDSPPRKKIVVQPSSPKSSTMAPPKPPPAASLAAQAAAKIQARKSTRLTENVDISTGARNNTNSTSGNRLMQMENVAEVEDKEEEAPRAPEGTSSKGSTPRVPGERRRPKVKKFLAPGSSGAGDTGALDTPVSSTDAGNIGNTSVPTAGKNASWRYSTGNVTTPIKFKSPMPVDGLADKEASAAATSPEGDASTQRYNPLPAPQQKKGFLLKRVDFKDPSSPCLKRFFTLENGELSYMDSTSKKPPFSMSHRLVDLRGVGLTVGADSITLEPPQTRTTSPTTTALPHTASSPSMSPAGSGGAGEAGSVGSSLTEPVVLQLPDAEQRSLWAQALWEHMQYSNAFLTSGAASPTAASEAGGECAMRVSMTDMGTPIAQSRQ